MRYMDKAGFYKNDNGQLLYAPNYVINKDYELYKEQKDEHEYPANGWYWFNTREEALEFFDIEEPSREERFPRRP